jgi:hypothetical protein
MKPALALVLLSARTTIASVHIDISSTALAETSSHFTCWNIDASRNRGFFDRNLSTALGAQLARQAKEIGAGQGDGYSLLRFGGSGNDALTYEVAGIKCPADHECLNMTWWGNLLNFTRASNAKLIFGVCEPKWEKTPPSVWDPTQAREILKWTIEQGQDDLLYGLELGNEVDGLYSGPQQAAKLHALQKLSEELWVDANRRPLLLGPDAAHQNSTEPHKPSPRDAYVHDFFEAAGKIGLKIAGATLHKYIEVTTERDTNATELDKTTQRFQRYKDTVLGGWADSGSTAKAPRLWGGEIG